MAGSEPVTITANLLGSSERGDALQVLRGALGGRAFGLLAHRKWITAWGGKLDYCVGRKAWPSALNAPL